MNEIRTKEEIEKRLDDVESCLDACAPEYGECNPVMQANLTWQRLELLWVLGMEPPMKEYQPKPLPKEYFA